MEAENGKRKTIYFRTNHPETPRSRSAAWTGKNGQRSVSIAGDGSPESARESILGCGTTSWGRSPREIDEAAIIDGASPLQLLFSVILPLIRPAIVTIIVTNSVFIYNDFANPLYFLPGSKNVTAQLTLFSFMSQYNSQWNLLFADVVLITIPPLILFMFFQRQIVSGMTSGAVKG